MFNTKKHYKGCYRVSNEGEYFGQIKQQGRSWWEAEIRKTQTGEIVRFAGIWNRKRDAVAEVEHILTQMN